MSQTVVEKTADQIAESARQASRVSSAIAEAIEDGLGVARRAVKHGGDAAEEILDDTIHRLERHVILTVVGTFAEGVAFGAALGFAVRRR
jgi:methyl-accepting chemotaxis protein